ncbi:hypothetical protein [Acidimangrovimonas pyrenivorans]|uniref:Uncharacterized protein n=1 Tax=Acidimangrovimonas pyrenivorans TaxID=2030798 RepID=A0ABV7AC52_9RHOB
MVELTALAFGFLSLRLYSEGQVLFACQALFAAAVLWALHRIAVEVAKVVRMKEYELDKPVQSAVLLMNRRKDEWTDEYLSLKRENGLPDWWGP